MRIVQVAPFFYPHTGGVESHVRAISRELVRQGHAVTVLTSRYDPALPGDEEVDGIAIRRAPTLFTWFNTPVAPAMRREVAALGADVVHMHYPPPLSAYYAARGLRTARVPVCLTYHCDLYLPGPAGRLLTALSERLFLPTILRRSDRIVVHARSYGITSNALRARELTVIPSAVDIDRFRPDLPADTVRRRLDLDGRRVLAFAGRLVPHKGVDTILRALLELPADVALLVIGAGPHLDSLVGLAERLRVEDRVRFVGAVPDEELAAYLRAADLFVFPSQNRLEGFGLVVAEAMACGLPVVIADMPGVREVIEPGKEGLLAEPLIASDLAAQVRVLLDDPPLARAMGAAGRRRAEKRYGLPIVARELLSLYAGLRGAG